MRVLLGVFFWAMVKVLSVYDIWRLFVTIWLYIVGRLEDTSVEEWLTMNNFSNDFKNVIRQYSVLLADVAEKVSILDLLKSVTLNPKLDQFKNPEKWLNRLEMKLKEVGVMIEKNTMVKDVKMDGELKRVSLHHFYSRKYYSTSRMWSVYGRNVMLCLPPYALSKLLMGAEELKYNWGVNIMKVLYRSFYVSIGFQVHYKEKFSLECEGLMCGPMVLLESSKYYEKFSKNDEIRTVLSGTIIDQRVLKGDLRGFILEEIYKITGREPEYITFYDGLRENRDKSIDYRWISKDTAYTRFPGDSVIQWKGVLDGVYIVNSCNMYGITTLDKSLKNVRVFMERYFL